MTGKISSFFVTLGLTYFIPLDVRRSVHHSIFHIKNPTICNSVSKFILYLYEAQHVSGDTPPIIRSL